MSTDMDRLVRGHNGEKTLEPFTPAEMEDRQTKLRLHMAEHDIDASVLDQPPQHLLLLRLHALRVRP